MKSVCLLTRREGTTRQAFREYYETTHAPLGMKYFPFRKYLRNHIIDASGDTDFDVIMECYFDDQINVSGVDAGEVRAIMDVDEKRFMNQHMIRSARVEERVLGGPPIGIAPPGTRRQMLLFSAADPTALDAWGADLTTMPGVARVSLDTAQQQAGNYAGFPYVAVLSLWFAESRDTILPLTPPPRMQLEMSCLTAVCETTPEELSARYAP